MTAHSTLEATKTLRPAGRVHVIGAGPVGLFLTALLQSIEGQAVTLYERRSEYTRTRMVSLADYLIADSIESYKADAIDGQSVEAIFDSTELETRLAYRRTIAPDLRALLHEWTRGLVPLNTIERTLAELIETRGMGSVERVARDVGADDALAMLEPGDILVDCTGSRSVMRDLLLPGDDLRRATGTRCASGSSTPWSSPSSTTSTTRAMSTASTTRTARTPATSSSRPSTAPGTTGQ